MIQIWWTYKEDVQAQYFAVMEGLQYHVQTTQCQCPTISNKTSNLKGLHELQDCFQSNKQDHKIWNNNMPTY